MRYRQKEKFTEVISNRGAWSMYASVKGLRDEAGAGSPVPFSGTKGQ